MAVIKPYDASQLGALEKSIRDSDLGVNPSNDGVVIRVVFPGVGLVIVVEVANDHSRAPPVPPA